MLVVLASVVDFAPTAPSGAELSSWAMMLIGFAGLGYAAHRRKAVAA